MMKVTSSRPLCMRKIAISAEIHHIICLFNICKQASHFMFLGPCGCQPAPRGTLRLYYYGHDKRWSMICRHSCVIDNQCKNRMNRKPSIHHLTITKQVHRGVIYSCVFTGKTETEASTDRYSVGHAQMSPSRLKRPRVILRESRTSSGNIFMSWL